MIGARKIGGTPTAIKSASWPKAVPSARQLRRSGEHESEADAEHDGGDQEKNRSAGDRSKGRPSRRDGSSEGHGPTNARTVGEEPPRYGGNRHRKERQGQDQRSKGEGEGQLGLNRGQQRVDGQEQSPHREAHGPGQGEVAPGVPGRRRWFIGLGGPHVRPR